MTLETQQDFEAAAREITQYLMRLDDRVMANKIYDFIVALNKAMQTFRQNYETERELGDQYYQQLQDAERLQDKTFDGWLVDRLKAALNKAPEGWDNHGIEYLAFFADGSGYIRDVGYDGWNTLGEFVIWLKNQKEMRNE